MSYESLYANQVPTLLAGQNIAIFDLRDEYSFARGHLEGSQPPSEENITRLIRHKNNDMAVLVYCYHGNSSRDLCRFLVQLGFRKVYNLEGGWLAWSAYVDSLPAYISPELEHWLGMNGFEHMNLHSRIMNGMTSLMYATLQGETGLVRELLEAGVDVNQVNDDGNNALWFACVNDDLAIIELLIEYGIDIDNQNVNGATALIYAASAGKMDVVKLLTENKANLYKKTLDDFTALDSAASMPVLKYLKKYYRQPANAG